MRVRGVARHANASSWLERHAAMQGRLPIPKGRKVLPSRQETMCLGEDRAFALRLCLPACMQLMRKYLAYARQFCHPRLTDAAAAVLRDFYLRLRQQVAPGSKNPITVSMHALH